MHGGDKLFLPVENLELLSRYGAEDMEVQLDRLGGRGWQERKARMKKRIREMAGELIKIAAARALREAPRLTPAQGIYDEFCARFPYDETEDQQSAIDAVLQDLASGRPMDRLVCGDVGFGKTEVALRAAFAAALSGRQVAVVVPTTLLARQHYKTFADRFKGLPVKVAQLSRFVSAEDTRQTKAGLASGDVDIVVGTHALLVEDDRVPRPRAPDHRRGAAFRRLAQGAAEAASRRGPCADPVGDADPAHAAACSDRRARAVDHRDAAGRSPGGAHLRHAVRSGDPARSPAARALSRRPELLRRAADRGYR